MGALFGALLWVGVVFVAVEYIREDGERCSGPLSPGGCEYPHALHWDLLAWGALALSAAAIAFGAIELWRKKRRGEASHDLRPPAPYPPPEPLYGYIHSSRIGYTPLVESRPPKVVDQIETLIAAREELAGRPWDPEKQERLAAYDRELGRAREQLAHAPGPDPERIREELARDEGLRRRIFERDAHRCRECGSRRALTIAHIVPVSRGGTNAEDNLRTLCRSCSSRKGARPAG